MNRFAFLLHLLTTNDLELKFPWAAKLPQPVIEGVLNRIPPLKVSHITGVRSKEGNEIEGWFILLPRTAKQLLEMPLDDAYKLIIRGGKIAEKLGAQIFGLGAFTKVIGDKGKSIARHLDIPVTTGNSYTTASAIESALLGAIEMGINPRQAEVTVIGATGAIGAACCHMLVNQVGVLNLVARTEENLKLLAQNLKSQSHTPVHINTSAQRAVGNADIIIAASSSTDTLVNPFDLKAGAVVCDVARPRNISKIVHEVRNDVLVIDGGVIRVPGCVDMGLNFGFPPGTVEACIAETMILTCEKRFENYTLGSDISLNQITEITALAKKHGFCIDGFRRFERAISYEEIAERKGHALLARTSG